MRRRLTLVSFALVLGAIGSFSLVAQEHRLVGDSAHAELLAQFDSLIQVRFKNFDEVGRRRVMTNQHGKYLPFFTPQPGDEERVFGSLQKQDADLALYIAGRGAIGYRRTAEARPENDGSFTGVISMPIRVTGRYRDEDLPTSDELISVARAVFEAGAEDLSSHGWRVAARPIVADQEACVRCHNGRSATVVSRPALYGEAPELRVGDTIGVVLYVSK